jgi:hypothetical protein
VVREFAPRVVDDAGMDYVARAFAEAGRLGSWSGFLEFEGEAGVVIRTDVETTQPSVGAVAYWASGLGEQYLRGALERAKRKSHVVLDQAPVLVREHSVVVTCDDGEKYAVRTCARPDPRGGWIGWLEFQPIANGAPVLRTGRETTQPTLQAVAYWADGLEPLYFEGAARRASPAGPPD